MKFFLSAEVQSSAASLLIQFHNTTQQHLDQLSERNYGDELNSISVITILVRKELLENGGYSERRLFQRKKRSADIRLRLDYVKFMCANPQQRYELYCQHILDSVETLRQKVSRHFRFNELIQDMTTVLHSEELRSQLTELRRYS